MTVSINMMHLRNSERDLTGDILGRHGKYSYCYASDDLHNSILFFLRNKLLKINITRITVSPSVYVVWFNSVLKKDKFHLEYVQRRVTKSILSQSWPHFVSHVPFPGLEFFSLRPSKCYFCSYLREELLSGLRKLGWKAVGFVWFCLGFKLNITNVDFSCLFTPYRNLNLYTLHLTLCQPTELRGLMAPLRSWVVK